LTCSKDKDGNISNAVNKDKDGNPVALSSDALQLVTAINDHSVKVEVSASIKATHTSTDRLMVGGAFIGSEITDKKATSPAGEEVYVVNAKQGINPNVLSAADEVHGKPGANTLHEATEAYYGALISQKSYKSSGPGSDTNPTCLAAHGAATPQSGEIRSRFLDKMGGPTPGMLPGVIYAVQFYVIDSKGKEVEIMRFK